MARPPSLTVLVPTYNRPAVLNLVWRSWLHQDGVTQIVLVNDGSSADYSPVEQELARACSDKRVELTIVRLQSRRGAPAARNAGIPHCRGQEVLVTDDDVELAPDLVAKCRESRPIGGGPAILGPRVVYLRDGETQKAAAARGAADSRAYCELSSLTLVPWVQPESALRVPFVTAVALWPRSLFDSGVRYYEGYTGNGYREETDPQLRAQAEYGASVYFVPSACAFHLPPGSAYVARGGQRRGGRLWFEYHVHRNNALFLWRYRRYLRQVAGRHLVSHWVALFASRMSPARVLPAVVRRRRGR